MNKIKGISDSTRFIIQQMVDQVRREAYAEGFEAGKLVATVDSVEGINDKWLAESKSPNQLRAELIEKAKRFVEEHTKREVFSQNTLAFKFNRLVVNEYFIVDGAKRTVVCLLKGARIPKVYSRGIAKCMPGEVFNEWIGKAIALAIALQIDIPVEFLQAVQPSEVVVGMHVDTYYFGGGKNEGCPTLVSHIVDGKPGFNNGTYSSKYKITDDTSAQYEVSI